MVFKKLKYSSRLIILTTFAIAFTIKLYSFYFCFHRPNSDCCNTSASFSQQYHFKHIKNESYFEKSRKIENYKNLLQSAPFSYLSKFFYEGCQILDDVQETFIKTDLNDCVLFCLGRFAQRIFIRGNTVERVQCICMKAGDAFASGLTKSGQCDFKAAYHGYRVQSYLSVGANSHTLKPSLASMRLKCVKTNEIDLQESVKAETRIMSEEVCISFCDKQKYVLSFHQKMGDLSNCSCADSFRNIFKAQVPCLKTETADSYVTKQSITDYGKSFCHNARLLTSEDSKYPFIPFVSVAGSGNTWIRHFIEEISGIFTGSVYSDKPKVETGLLGDMMKFQHWHRDYLRTFVIKSHNYHNKSLTHPGLYILRVYVPNFCRMGNIPSILSKKLSKCSI